MLLFHSKANYASMKWTDKLCQKTFTFENFLIVDANWMHSKQLQPFKITNNLSSNLCVEISHLLT